MSKRIGIFGGSFDPITFGHIDIIERGLKLVDELVLAIGNQHHKSAIFTAKERAVLIADCIKSDKLKIVTFDGLLVDEAKRCGANFLLRSLRNNQDFEYEKSMAAFNFDMAGIETINLFAAPQYSHISSSLVRQIAKLDGDVAKFVPQIIITSLKSKLN